MEMGPDTLAQQERRISAGLSRSVLSSFLEGGLMLFAPSSTLTAQVPQIPAPPQLPVSLALSGYTSECVCEYGGKRKRGEERVVRDGMCDN
jgi:hypothetical protein